MIVIALATLAEWLDDIRLRRVRRNGDKILTALRQLEAQEWDEWHYGLDVLRASHLGAGKFYEAISYLEEYRVIAGTFEPGTYPRRRLYRLVSLSEAEE